jgi:hypothetical protein
MDYYWLDNGCVGLERINRLVNSGSYNDTERLRPPVGSMGGLGRESIGGRTASGAVMSI